MRSLLLILALSFTTSITWGEHFVTASSIRRLEHIPFYAMDNDEDTRWSSDTAQPVEWLQIDLGREVPIDGLRIRWEYAYAVGYTIEVSPDASTWHEVYRKTEGTGGTVEITDLNVQGRYLRFLFTESNYTQLFSIWELHFTNPEAEAALQEQITRVEAEELRIMREEQARLRPALAAEGVEEIVFVTRAMYEDVHWYANISYFAADENHETYVHGAGLYKLHVPTGKVIPLIDDPDGTLRDPAVHYDGKTILFSWRKGGTKSFHLYTIQSDGTGLTQLTSGEYDDFEPAWLPDGGIAFVSTRCRRWVNCWFTQVATVHRCDADGRNIKPLSANLEQDNTPWPMPDGRLLYTRWEYIDRSQVDYHHLWTMNPDGTNQAIFYGNLHPGGLYIDAKAVPGTDEVLTINSPMHGKREHEGYIALVDAKKGPDEQDAMRTIAEGIFTDPYPVTQDLFMAAQRYSIVIIHRDGRVETLHKLDKADRPRRIHEPRPLVARPRERLIPPRADYAQHTGLLVLADAHVGRNMDGIEAGDVKRLLVVETLPKPINYGGGMEPITYGGSFTLERILGSVPVEDDGSAYMELPANRSLFLIAQDKDGNTIKRMQSFLSVMPGETTGCVGCHEQRTQTFANSGAPNLKALQRPASKIEPIPNIPEVFDFPRDIQPILDKHCLKCHDYVQHGDHGPRSGGIILSGDHGPIYSHSYMTLTVHRQIADGRNLAKSNYAPGKLGAVASPLMHKVLNHHHGVRLSQHEIDLLTYWIETGAPYPGTYAAMGGGSIGGQWELVGMELDHDWPASIAAAEVFEQRCATCHTGKQALPATLTKGILLPSDEMGEDDPRFIRTRHFVFNLSHPEHSLMLLAPLSKAAGGYGQCMNADGNPVFRNTEDPAYQTILAMCQAGKDRLETIKRFDMPGFRPPEPYLREMKRYKVLPEDLPEEALIDPYATDQAYWASFEQEVALDHEVYAEQEPRYIFLNKAPGIEWYVGNPDSFSEAGFREIIDAIQPPENPALRLGVSHVFDLFRVEPEVLAESLRRFLAASQAAEVPVLVCFDGQNWWEQRPDLWNWWDPDQPGYDPANAKNVEWTDWDPSHAVKIGWRNWGSQIRVAPAPNIASPAVLQAHLERLEVLVPIVADWYRALPEEKKYLLGGVKFGHEASIGVNAYHYPEGNQYLDRPASEDPTTSFNAKQGWHGGQAKIGYAAAKTAGIKDSGELTREDIAEVTRRYLETLCKTAYENGLPQHLTYSHQGGTYAPWEKHLPFDAANNAYAIPGYSFYFTDPAQAEGLSEALSADRRWAAVEWWWGAADEQGWRDHLEGTLRTENCRLISIFNWNCGFKFKEETEGIEALRGLFRDWREK